MMLLQKSAASLKLWMGEADEPAPPLCGAVPAESNHICQPSDLVAARVKSTDGDENWILAEVVTGCLMLISSVSVVHRCRLLMTHYPHSLMIHHYLFTS